MGTTLPWAGGRSSSVSARSGRAALVRTRVVTWRRRALDRRNAGAVQEPAVADQLARPALAAHGGPGGLDERLVPRTDRVSGRGCASAAGGEACGRRARLHTLPSPGYWPPCRPGRPGPRRRSRRASVRPGWRPPPGRGPVHPSPTVATALSADGARWVASVRRCSPCSAVRILGGCVGVAGQGEDLGVVDQAVDHRSRHDVVGKGLSPPPEGQVQGDHHRALLVA